MEMKQNVSDSNKIFLDSSTQKKKKNFFKFFDPKKMFWIPQPKQKKNILDSSTQQKKKYFGLLNPNKKKYFWTPQPKQKKNILDSPDRNNTIIFCLEQIPCRCYFQLVDCFIIKK